MTTNKILPKVRGFVTSKEMGTSVEGVPVSLVWSINLLPIEKTESGTEVMSHDHPIRKEEISDGLQSGVIPQYATFGVLYSDHVGYFSFDLSRVEWLLSKISCKLLGRLIEQAEKLANNHVQLMFSLICPSNSNIRRDIPLSQLLGPLSFIDNPLTFNLEVDSSVPRTKQRLGYSIQNPDLLDWEISPKSFVGNPAPNLDNDNVINLLPSTHASHEYYFHELSNSLVVNSLNVEGLSGDYPTRDVVNILSDTPLSLMTNKSNLATTASTTSNQSPWMKGEVKEYRQTWFPQGHALGDILYSLALAPGESSEIAVIDWSREDTASRAEDTEYNESLAHMQRHDRMIDETVTGGLREEQSGGSEMWGGGIAAGVQNAAEGVLLGMLKLSGASQLGITGGYGNVSTNSSGIRNLSGRSVQNIADQVVQNSSLKRGLRSTVIMQATQKEKNVLQTRTITNPNHGHALTVQYYEVLRHFKVVTEYVGKRDVLLIPFSLIEFNEDNILRFKEVLQASLLDSSLANHFSVLTDKNYNFPIIPPNENPQPPQQDVSSVFWEGDEAVYKMEITVEVGNKSDFDEVDENELFFYIRWWEENGVDGKYTWKWTPWEGAHFNERRTYKKDVFLDYKGTANGIQRSHIHYVGIENNSDNEWDLANIEVSWFSDKIHGKTLWRANNLHFFKKGGNSTAYHIEEKVKLPPKPQLETQPQKQIDTPDPKIVYETGLRTAKINLLVGHFNKHKFHYSKAIWLTQDPQERAYLFGPYLSSLIENTPVAISGNYLAFPFVGDNHVTTAEDNQKETRIISLPTRGVFAEVFLSNNPGIEKRDITRYWNWMDTPVRSAPSITGVQPSSPNAPLNTTPSNLPSPTVQIMNAPSVPDPVGLAGALKVLGTPDIFRDMSGINQVSSLLDNLISGAVDMAQAKQMATQAKEALNKSTGKSSGGGSGTGTSNTTTRSLPSEPDPVKQIDKLDAIKYAKQEGLMDDKQANDAARGVVGGEPVGDYEPGLTPPQIDSEKPEKKLIEKKCGKGVCLLTYSDENERYSYYVTNETYDYIDFTIDLEKLENFLRPSKSVPYRTVISPRVMSEEHLLNIEVIDKSIRYKAGGPPIIFNHYLGNPNAKPDGTLYALPYPKGEKYKCTQGFKGKYSHSSKNAVDLDMPEGSIVCAARDGVVVEIKADSTVVGSRDPKDADKANFVRILHKDGTYAQYAHLQTGGVKVNVGSSVSEGEEIALSGNTGFSTGPHLHFEVLVVDGKGGWKTSSWKFKDETGQAFEPKANKEYENKSLGDFPNPDDQERAV
ncbi:hypothetical protein THII_3107 [Thioploca ingrica]|uniref:M23ase beta-sheet core domain-containing protein n=1 Tax=Thioploca ingrica TaxID=40754 RepID=A0A090AJ20_9GAMM|nr:hypothetical protein THII_3107 [Thioploca ingrica]